MYYEKTRKTGFIPPEAFMYLDKKNYLQDNNNTPIIYHVNIYTYNFVTTS
jgi:hypothetical protein